MLSLFGTLAIATGAAPSDAWRLCSLTSVAVLVAAGVSFVIRFVRFRVEDLPPGGRAVFCSSNAVIVGTCILLVCNMLFLGSFWPFLTAIQILIAIAILQFIRLVIFRPTTN
jgi:hypothetical protein